MKFGSEVAFVDAGIADGARLVEGLDENVESHVISADGPALEQMAAAVAHRKGLTAIHVFAHGRAGTLAFAAGDVDASIFDGSRDALQQLSQALAPDAAINLWSCDVASGTAGSTFVSGLSIWLGRPVHAAAGKIGAAGLGGSWMLAGSDGAVMPPLTAEAVAGYAGVLASNAATTATDLITQTANADTLIVTSTGQIQAADLFDGAGGLDTILVSGAAGVTVDLSGAGTTQATGFRNHEILSFNNTSGTTTVTLNAAQFGTGLIASALSVVGSAGLQRININNATVFSATAWTFTSWTSGADAISITGTAGADTLTGSSQADLLSGLSGNDMLDGGAGADTMAGGLGDDTYVVDNAGDVVTENAGEGTDTVLSSVTRTLAANIEKLTLTGTAAISGTGNTLANVITGNNAANLIDGGSGADTMIGGKGDDTYVVDNAGDIITEKASEGVDRVQSSVTYTLAANVEHLTLTGTAAINGIGNELANIITGNAANNTLTGKAGNDTLNGGAGADKMVGGLGNDTYVVDNAGDTAVEVDGEGIDIVQSSVGFVLGTGVDNLTLTGTAMINGTGNTLNNVIIGNSAANVLYGYAGNDTLNGGAGADQMFGGLGNDIYVIDNSGDVAVEAAGEGIDTIQTGMTTTLSANFENLTLTGASAVNGTGNGSDNVMQGNAAANILTGLVGNDTLNGGGGADTMIGGKGNDIYVVDNLKDVVTENAGEGTDTVQSSVAFTLAVNFENLILLGSNATSGTGNAADNVLTGNAGANTLTGLAGNDTIDGGVGADKLIGGLGNDTYIVDNTNDVVTENAGEGTDLVQSSVTYTIGANVENLTLTGTKAINGTGNSLANVITGNAAGNVLDGGLGADRMVGGLGNDTYVIDNASDVIVEAAGEGTDTVRSQLTHTLGAAFENLVLIGTSAINGTGNASDNVLTGNDAANTLRGLDGVDTISGGAGNDFITGGFGADRLTGGLGNDTFVFTAITDSMIPTSDPKTGQDLITDFQLGDRIDLSAIDANTSVSGDQAFVLDTNGVLAVGEVMVTYNGNTAIVDVNLSGDATPEMRIIVQGTASTFAMTAADFIL